MRHVIIRQICKLEKKKQGDVKNEKKIIIAVADAAEQGIPRKKMLRKNEKEHAVYDNTP